MGLRTVEIVQEELAARFAELAALELAGRTEGQVLAAAEAAQRLSPMAEGHAVATAAVLDASRAWVADGAVSAASHLAWRCRLPRERADRHVRTGRALRDMPLVEAALLAGTVAVDHVRVLASAQRAAPEAFAAGGERTLLDAAVELRFPQLEVCVRYWRHLHAWASEEERARRRWDERRAHCSATFEGSVVLDALLDPIGGEVVARELARLERELFEEDLAEARERLGPDAPLHELRRTPAQRRADALRRMAERSAAKPAGAVEARVLVHVLAGHESVERMCELSSGRVVAPGEVLPLLAAADVARVVFDGPSRVLDLGVRQRRFTGATRLAVQLRDRTCTHPSCDVPAERCEVDHVVPYDDGGPTVQANGRCLCRYHHRRARPPGADPPP